MKRPLRIAHIGHRGVPATFGGIEHHVEEIGARLADAGHEVVAYCRTNYVEERLDEYRGIRLRHLPTVGTKHFDNIAHSALSTLDALKRPPDIVHYHALGPALVTPLPRFFSRSKVVLTVHGLDYARDKWGWQARMILRTAGWMSARVPNATIVVSQALGDHYASKYRRVTHHIPNGVNEPVRRQPNEITERFGLHGDGYLLFVGRLVPEKAPDLLIRAFRTLPTDVKLVIAGGSGFTDDYVQSLYDLGRDDPRVVFTGPVYGDTLDELYSNARAFVLPSNLEGLPLTLLEAASFGTPVVVSDIAPHLEIVREGAPGRRVFHSGNRDDLAEALRSSISGGRPERDGAEGFRQDVLARYRWDAVTEATLEVYEQLVFGTGSEATQPDAAALQV